MSVSPVLKTVISKCDISTSAKLRFYVKRTLNVKGDPGLSRLTLYGMFKSLCDHELQYQELISDLNISCFCRTGVVDTSVILEADCDSDTFRERLQIMTLTTEDVRYLGKYLQSLHRKTCLHSSPTTIQDHVKSKFMCESKRSIILKRVFEEPLRKVQGVICCKQFGEKHILRNIDTLTETFLGVTGSVVHGNFCASNVVIKDTSSCGKVIAFGSELSHLGNPLYDAGTFIGELFMWYYLHKRNADCSVKSKEFCEVIQQCIVEFGETYLEDIDLLIDDDTMIDKIISTITGFTGITILFRVMGNDWNDALPMAKCSVWKDMVACSYRLIDGFQKVESFSQMVAVGLKQA